jgi:hypothetical protein
MANVSKAEKANVSKAEKKRRVLVQRLIDQQLLPPRLERPDIFAHADVGQLPYALLPKRNALPSAEDKVRSA